jgi:predicted PurR-regulated permease PerM
MNNDINSISNRTVIRILAIVVVFLVGIFAIIALREQLIWLGISFFFALALERPVEWLSKRLPRGSRGFAVFIVVASAVVTLAATIYFLGPPIAKQFGELVNNLPKYYNDLINDDNPASSYLRNINTPSTLSLSADKVAGFISSTGGGVAKVFGGIFNSIFAFFSIIVFTFFMVLEWPKMHELFWRYQDPAKREHRKKLYSRMQKTVSGYVGGNILTSLIAGVTALIFFIILGNPYAVALAFIVAILDLIPMFGALLASVIGIVVALVFGGMTPAVITAIFFVVYQQIENNILQPLVFSKTINISPLVAGVAALIGAALAGLIGALVAIPVAASLQIVVIDYLERRYPEKIKSIK